MSLWSLERLFPCFKPTRHISQRSNLAIMPRPALCNKASLAHEAAIIMGLGKGQIYPALPQHTERLFSCFDPTSQWSSLTQGSPSKNLFDKTIVNKIKKILLKSIIAPLAG